MFLRSPYQWARKKDLLLVSSFSPASEIYELTPVRPNMDGPVDRSVKYDGEEIISKRVLFLLGFPTLEIIQLHELERPVPALGVKTAPFNSVVKVETVDGLSQTYYQESRP